MIVERRPGTCGGRPVLAGTRIELQCLRALILAGYDYDGVDRLYDLPPGTTREALDPPVIHHGHARLLKGPR
jgi:uncharacterized protein (DUF433 family)